MKIQIRKAVFETNSSSSHSLTLSKGDVQMLTLPPEALSAGRIMIGCDDFGWDWERMYKPENKLTYLVTAAVHGELEDGYSSEALTAEYRERYPKIDRLCRVVADHTGCELLLIPGSNGYVDHNSVGSDNVAYESDERLRQFIFGTDAFVETGNDNSSAPADIKSDLTDVEDYYAVFRAEIPTKGYAKTKLCLRRYEIQTLGGLSLETQPDIAPFLEKGVVTSAVLTVNPDYRFYSDMEGSVLTSICETKLNVSHDLAITLKRDKSLDTFTEVLELEVYLPEAIAEKVEALV